MKYFSNILATIFVALFLLSFGMKSEAVGQCPSGWSSTTVTMSVGSCNYDVQICYKCGLAYPGEATIVGLTLLPSSPPCTPLPINTVIQQLYSQMSTYNFFLSNLCPYMSTVPPCPEGSEEVKIYHNICWKKKKIIYFGEETFYYTPCSSDVCVETFKWCTELPSMNVIKIPISTVPNYTTISCTLEGHEITEPVNVGDESECFIYHSLCNPSE